MSLMDFVVSPPGCGRSVSDFWGWDAHEAQLRCPDDVDGGIWIWSTGRGPNPLPYTVDCETVWATDVLLLVLAFCQ
jgi:hypothetical protein